MVNSKKIFEFFHIHNRILNFKGNFRSSSFSCVDIFVIFDIRYGTGIYYQKVNCTMYRETLCLKHHQFP
jgi:hypothetical protein